jgi:hypothetical protein
MKKTILIFAACVAALIVAGSWGTRAVAAAVPPPGILQNVKPSSQGVTTINGATYYCRKWVGNGRFAIECIGVKVKKAS